jgi:exonuclease III
VFIDLVTMYNPLDQKNLKLASVNIRGLHGPHRMSGAITWVKNLQKVDVALIQETHITNPTALRLEQSLPGATIFYSQSYE